MDKMVIGAINELVSWEIKYSNGIFLPQIGWWLDAHKPAGKALVSHAHFDHIAAHKEVVCTRETARLMQERLPRKRIEHVLPYGHSEQLTDDCVVTLYPAGHIYGSALIHLEHREHGSLLYTGDFKLRPSLSAGTCATPHADLLIMETTFGRPNYLFPPAEKVYAEIHQFCRQALAEGLTPVLMAYSLGKCQELLTGLTGLGVPVMLHTQCEVMTRVHEELGLVFPSHREFVEAEQAGHVVICPPLSVNSAFLKKIPKRRTAVATGWALDRSTVYRQQCDAAFPLSDHADYGELLQFVDLVKPRQVLTLHGFAADFAGTLRRRGVEALALGVPNQLELL